MAEKGTVGPIAAAAAIEVTVEVSDRRYVAGTVGAATKILPSIALVVAPQVPCLVSFELEGAGEKVPRINMQGGDLDRLTRSPTIEPAPIRTPIVDAEVEVAVVDQRRAGDAVQAGHRKRETRALIGIVTADKIAYDVTFAGIGV